MLQAHAKTQRDINRQVKSTKATAETGNCDTKSLLLCRHHKNSKMHIRCMHRVRGDMTVTPKRERGNDCDTEVTIAVLAPRQHDADTMHRETERGGAMRGEGGGKAHQAGKC